MLTSKNTVLDFKGFIYNLNNDVSTFKQWDTFIASYGFVGFWETAKCEMAIQLLYVRQ